VWLAWFWFNGVIYNKNCIHISCKYIIPPINLFQLRLWIWSKLHLFKSNRYQSFIELKNNCDEKKIKIAKKNTMQLYLFLSFHKVWEFYIKHWIYLVRNPLKWFSRNTLIWINICRKIYKRSEIWNLLRILILPFFDK